MSTFLCFLVGSQHANVEQTLSSTSMTVQPELVERAQVVTSVDVRN